MGSLEFRDQLAHWSKAGGPVDLVNRILGGPQAALTADPKIAKRLRKKVEVFLIENENQLNTSDLPALINLQDHIHTFQLWTKEIHELNLILS